MLAALTLSLALGQPAPAPLLAPPPLAAPAPRVVRWFPYRSAGGAWKVEPVAVPSTYRKGYNSRADALDAAAWMERLRPAPVRAAAVPVAPARRVTLPASCVT